MLLALAASPVPPVTISMSSPVTARENRRSGSTITIFLCGDVMLGRGIDQVLPFPSDPKLHEDYVDSALGYVRLAEEAHGPIPRPIDFDYVWGAALNEWRRVNSDLRLINLETAITRSDAFEPKGINYRMSPENARCLLAAGVDCCGLANNHVLDWGEPGLIETLQVLKRLGISAAGAGPKSGRGQGPCSFGYFWDRACHRLVLRDDDERNAAKLGRDANQARREPPARSVQSGGRSDRPAGEGGQARGRRCDRLNPLGTQLGLYHPG